MNKLLFFTVMFLTFTVCNVNKTTSQNTNGTNDPATAKLWQEEKEDRNKTIALANVEAIHAPDLKTEMPPHFARPFFLGCNRNG